MTDGISAADRHSCTLTEKDFEDARLNKTDRIIDNRIEKISKAYFQIDELMDEIETLLRAAEDYPAEISKEDAQQVQSFLESAGKVIREYFPLFVGFSDE